MLNIKDINIKFFKNGFEKKVIKDVETFIYKGYIEKKPLFCPNCNAQYNKNIIIHGYREKNILIPRVSNFKTILNLKIQRYKCKCCDGTFSQETSIVDKHCFISNNTKISIALASKNKISEKDIAKNHDVSHNTCSRVIDNFYKFNELNLNFLPGVLSFDEFKSTKNCAGAMSFIMVDPVSRNIVDILEDRRLYNLKKYFNMYSKEARDSVNTVIIDMYSPYISLIKSCFKNADIIFDRFHIVNLVNRELNKCRINLMKNFNKSSREYKILKSNTKLLLKKEWDLDSIHFYRRAGFIHTVSDKTIVETMLELDESLKNTYRVYQNILRALDIKSVALLEKEVFNTNNNDIFTGMKKALRTLKRYFEYVKNAFQSEYSNGYVEAVNNKIKVIKRIAYGYRCFTNLRKRVFIINNLIQLK